MQCAVRAAALQVMHARSIEITRELLHQPLTSLVATARSTQGKTTPQGSEEAAATLEKIQGQLEAHLRDLELRAALGADSTSTSVTNITPGAGFPASVVPVREPHGASTEVYAAAAPAASSSADARHAGESGAGNGVEAGTEAGSVGSGVTTAAQQRDALLALAGRSGAALASGMN
jgi:hypothetical protein